MVTKRERSVQVYSKISKGWIERLSLLWIFSSRLPLGYLSERLKGCRHRVSVTKL